MILVAGLPMTACGSSHSDVKATTSGLQVGIAALAGGAPEAALSVARRQLSKNRDDTAALLVEGQALTELGDFAQAENSFKRASQIAPTSSGAQFGLGRVYLLAGKAAEAEVIFSKLLGKMPEDARALINLGIACDMQDRHPEAQKAYTEALRVAPAMEAARVNMGLSLALSGDPVAAVDILRPIAANPNASRRVRHDLATALALAGDRDGAAQLLRSDLPSAQIPMALAGYRELLIH